ncbi:hypothetical protein C6P46_006838 [Rhodotorula mucilaginosa]|uniref:RlpA-like protein double-psi beta-barrel domain-containing protein n=1 Tax=Rhodotorula mucilaginosa TaxID=5537 RepID=A0A9P6W6K6_RHOMI|nr:hypothetical protein C6P46_006838 [Rhodotorula mucilaginosa]
MKFSVTACILALSMLSTAQAACHRRSRRSYGEALIPSSAGVARALPEPKVIKPVVRRHKGGRRMDLERRADAVRESWAQRAHHDSLSGPSSAASVTGESSSSGGDISSTTTTSTSYEAATGSTNAAAASATASSSSSSSSSSGTYSGQATFFYQDGNAGACGTTHQDSDRIVALQTEMYGTGQDCGRTVTITNTSNGKSVTATVADECPGCSSSASLDLSTGTFDAIASEDTGEVPITWSFTD